MKNAGRNILWLLAMMAIVAGAAAVPYALAGLGVSGIVTIACGELVVTRVGVLIIAVLTIIGAFAASAAVARLSQRWRKRPCPKRT